MQDGLGLVFEKRGDTGAAAYTGPAQGLAFGFNPLDRLADDVGRMKTVEFQQKQRKERLDQMALEVGGQGWEIDNDRELGSYLQGMKSRFGQLYASGVKPNDYTNPASREYWELQRNWENLKSTSLGQKAEFQNTYKALLQDYNSPNPQFDHEQSFAALRQWQQLPIAERIKTPIESLIIKREQPYDALAPIEKFKIEPYIGSKGSETPESGFKTSTLNKEGIRKEIDGIIDNPLWQDNYNQGVRKGLWENKREWGNFLYEQAANRYTPKTEYEKKAPKKGNTYVDIYSGTADEWLSKLGVGIQYPSVPSRETQGDKTINVPTMVKNAITLGNINATISGQTARRASDGNFLDAKARTLVSGTLSTPLVYSTKGDANRVVTIPKEGGTFKVFNEKTGKAETYTGTYDQIAQQLITAGIAEYKPMIEGIAKDGEESETVWVPADAVVHPSAEKNKPLDAAEEAYYILKRWADEQNGKTQQQGGTKQVSRTTIKSLVGKPGYEGYTEQELIDYYKSQGYQIQ